ncbi:MAG TPA: VOC family protein [Holophagaceae bacterium]|jgi:PhnB protein|nr:VOC family protein [Holophagaceae bacterium]
MDQLKQRSLEKLHELLKTLGDTETDCILRVPAMADTNHHSPFTPEGWHSVTPRIVAQGAEQLVEFLKQVFGATGEYRPDRPAEMKIGDSIVMITDAGLRDPMPAFLYVYVESTDKTYRQALQAGAISLEEPSETPYGDHRCMVKDKWGNTWQIATRIRRLS